MLSLALIAVLALPQDPPHPGVSEVSLETPKDFHEEHFFLQLDGGETVGIAALRRSKSERGVLLEWEARFFVEDLRLLHIERSTAEGQKLVWREIGAGRGRSLNCERSIYTQTLKIVEWDDPCVREEFPAAADVWLPLALLEAARADRLPSGRMRVFEPLSRSIAEVELALHPLDLPPDTGLRVALTGLELLRFLPAVPASAPSAGPRALGAPSGAGELGTSAAAEASSPLWQVALAAERTCELRRADGTLFCSGRFRGQDLLEWRWQDGGLVVERSSPEEFERLSTERVAEGWER